jgi:hypothetical protein
MFSNDENIFGATKPNPPSFITIGFLEHQKFAENILETMNIWED